MGTPPLTDDEAPDSRRVGPVGPPPRTPSLRTRALQHLARREHSRSELARKLSPHAESPELLETLLDDLERLGQLSNARYAEARATQLARKFGPARIAHELRGKGIDPEIMEGVMSGVRVNTTEQARTVWAKRFGRPPANALERVKQMRFMQMRGFPQDVIMAVVPKPGQGEPDDDAGAGGSGE